MVHVVYIQKGDGEKVQISWIGKGEEVSDFRARVAAEFKVVKSKMSLIFNGRRLQDDSGTLVEYRGLDIDSVIQFLLQTSPLKTSAQKRNFESCVSSPELEKAMAAKRVKTVLPPCPPTPDATFVSLTNAAENTGPWCPDCLDDPGEKCTECSCQVCKSKVEVLWVCNQCEYPYHADCIRKGFPIPADDDQDWYCHECYNDPNASANKKRKVRGYAPHQANKGNGMSNVSVRKKCQLKLDHAGPIPGVKVGQTWGYREQVASAGVHRGNTVAGIHSTMTVTGKGHKKRLAFSIVSSGGYAQDDDNGNILWYTGEGGRNNKDKNTRTSKQVEDQKWDSRGNEGLRNACISKQERVLAPNWQQGHPIRVVRGMAKGKRREHTEFDPEIPENSTRIYRYDGIYKVAMFWTETTEPDKETKDTFKICRFELRRVDDAPAPWTPEGQELAKQLKADLGKGQQDAPKEQKYELPEEHLALLKEDTKNAQLWEICLEAAKQGYNAFLAKVAEEFECGICQIRTIEGNPLATLDCGHNFHTQPCLSQFFGHDFKTCPMCSKLIDQGAVQPNSELDAAFKAIIGV